MIFQEEYSYIHLFSTKKQMLPSAGLGEVTIFGVYGGLKLSVVLFNAKLAVELF